ncbi:MAG: hypothetical protein Q8K75_08890 [Chlamydiales bacterium]|nr:hypothetical protein [Chlamydiales bacterium]
MTIPNITNQDIPCKACENSTPVDQAIGITVIAGLALTAAYVVKKCFDATEENKSLRVQPTWTAAILEHAAIAAFTVGYIIFLEVITAVAGPLVAVAIAIGLAAAYTVTVFKPSPGLR